MLQILQHETSGGDFATFCIKRHEKTRWSAQKQDAADINLAQIAVEDESLATEHAQKLKWPQKSEIFRGDTAHELPICGSYQERITLPCPL